MIFEDWVQPIATFATKGAAPGKVLSELVISAVIQLHNHGASVLAVISDGAGNNRSMWSQLRISGKLDSACQFIEHPLEPSQNIYFICDIPRVIKCIRNHLKKHTYGMVRANGALQMNKPLTTCSLSFRWVIIKSIFKITVPFMKQRRTSNCEWCPSRQELMRLPTISVK